MSDFNKIYRNVKEEAVQPIYLLQGTESYFIELFKAKVAKTLSAEIEDEIITYDLREVAIQDVIVDAETLPFFTDKKLIIVENPLFLQSKPEKIPVEHDLAALEAYVKNPVPYTVLLFIAPYEKLDARKKITKLLQKETTLVPCAPLRENALRQWLLHMAREENVTIDEEACNLLETEFQTNLSLLEQEIKKLALRVGENGHITSEITKDLMSTSLNQNALQLVDAVLQKNLNEAIHIAKTLEKNREEPIALLALLSYQFRIIFQVKLLVNKGYPLQRIQSEVKVHPYVVKLARERSNRFSIKTLEKMIESLANTDAKIKRGQMDKQIAFELLLYELVTA